MECIKKIRSFGMDVMGSFIIGNDFDDAETISLLKQFIHKSNMIFPDVSILTPYPGCDLYAEMESRQQLLHKQWDKYDNQHVVFTPKKMSPAELERTYTQLLHEVFSAEVMSKKLEYLQGAVSRKRETLGFALLLPSYGITMFPSLGLKSQNTKKKPGRFGLFDRFLTVIMIMSLLPYVRNKTKITAISLIKVVLSEKMNAFDVIYLLLIFDMDNFLRGKKTTQFRNRQNDAGAGLRLEGR